MDPAEKPPTPPPEASEDDLSNLLDSCIDDFNKPLPKPATPQPAKTVAKSPDTAANWSAEFKEFSDVMGNLVGDESEMDEIRKLMEGCMDGLPQLDDENFANSFADTIRHLTEQAQNVPETSPEDLANLLGSLDVGGDGGDGMPGLENMPELMPLMQGVMQKLMSKELLYPSLKEIVDKYPAWLEENKATVAQSDYSNYEKQFELMKVICGEFEKEESTSEEGKKKQFETVLQLMQKIQTYGNPPKELVANIGPGVPLDEQGNLQIPGMPGNCVVM